MGMKPTYIIDGKEVTQGQWEEFVGTMHDLAAKRNNAVTTQKNLKDFPCNLKENDDNGIVRQHRR
jgi:formylglycine-generating enzyme required for sulfatase activity